MQKRREIRRVVAARKVSQDVSHALLDILNQELREKWRWKQSMPNSSFCLNFVNKEIYREVELNGMGELP